MPNRVVRRFGASDTSDIRERAYALYPEGITLTFNGDEWACICNALATQANACANASAYGADTLAIALRVRILEMFRIEEM